ncbi:MAG: hypothetical protein COA99_14270 [Moraxellaceae bacterium]|nr:MAG: hypothetical protein COA99_14270 [Moraxellaceae bacterium]
MAIPHSIGKYTVIKALGAGGFGAVYLAEDPKLNAKVAIKVFSINDVELAQQATSSSSDVGRVLHDRFLSEAKILRQLSINANIVDVYDFGEMDDGTPYFVMPYLERSLVDEIGKDVLTSKALEDLPANEHPRKLPVQRVVQILKQVLAGLAEVHDAKLIHRDIKPANILFNARGMAQLCDFGIVKSPDSIHSQSGVAIGSRNYMSPEQRESAKHVTTRSDVYSVGVLAYRMVTGTLPVGPCDDPIVYSPEIGEPLNTLILDALNQQPNQRPADAGELLRRLTAAVKQLEVNKTEYNDTTYTAVGEAPQPIREELRPLEEKIQHLLLEHGEIPENQMTPLKMMASGLTLTEPELFLLMDAVEKRLASQLRPIRHFFGLVDDALIQQKGKLSDFSVEHLLQTGKQAGITEEKLSSLIAKRQSLYIEQRSKSIKKPRKIVLLVLGILLVIGGWWVANRQQTVVEDKAQVVEDTLDAVEEAPETPEVITQQLEEIVMPATPTYPQIALIAIPGGYFQMGSAQDETTEMPLHPVTIKPFQLAITEVTWNQYQFCIDAGDCSANIRDEGWGRGDKPVINVSWYDVQTYITWLNKQSGQHYRLPSEAEWEYAARAGSASQYSWGDAIGRNQANCDGCGSRWDDRQPAPVASFAANTFGLFDMHGNVWEWVQDCWNDNYQGAPNDGSAWESGVCHRRVLRGGSWHNVARYLRSSHRTADGQSNTYFNFGFRLAHDL